MNAAEAHKELRQSEARLTPFLFTEVMGGRILHSQRLPSPEGLSLQDLVLVDEANDEELLAFGRKSSAQIYMPRESLLADGVLTSEDLKTYRQFVGSRRPELSFELPLQDYYMHRVRNRSAQPKKPALFLDRDGTLIELVPYVKDPELVCLMPGIVKFLKDAVARGYLLVCVTNQSGLGRGYYDLREFQAVQERMNHLLAREGLELDGSFFAGFHAESDNLLWAGRGSLRKPRPGMLLEASKYLSIDMSRSLMIGDSLVDMQVGGSAGVARSYQILGTNDVHSHFGVQGQRIESFEEIDLSGVFSSHGD